MDFAGDPEKVPVAQPCSSGAARAVGAQDGGTAACTLPLTITTLHAL